ncbi:T-protein [Actinoplanes sp. SE50]|nr:T-protein [Actinoplanes sp. SE50/110]ATO80185.1 T-protein [Actinoplanes sp. SE50]SLL97589.1 Intracellular chorismate mutase [Actinoplanes sp. SE50/110]
MTADVMNPSTDAARPTTPPSTDAARPTTPPTPDAAPPASTPAAATDKAAAAAIALDASTGAGRPLAADEIRALRERIDEIDQAIIDLWQERSRLSQEVGKTRMASGGTRLVLAREREIVDRFRAALGPDGTQVALLLLRSGRGPL